jgi:DNA invertase Pin-like site-specific DNA recombinase/peptidoglycan hydrolase-like protein with peptidoglycan-binding domain
MTTHLVALGDWRRTTTVLLALVAAAVLMTAAAPAPASAATKQTPLLAQGVGMGDKPSTAVRRVQRVLHDRGYSLGAPGVDGRFGPITDAAVRNLQADSGLVADGIVGPRTRKVVRGIERRSQLSDEGRTSQRTKQAKPDTAKTQAKAKPKPQPKPQSKPSPQTAATSKDEGNGTNAGWLVAIVLAAALAAACARLVAMTRRRPGRRPDGAAAAGITPLTHELYLEGRSDDESVGDFRGNAIAARMANEPGEVPGRWQTWYLVDDQRKPAPVWVRDVDVRRSPSGLVAGEPVIGYVTVSSEAQRNEADPAVHAIEAACQRAGLELLEVVTDRESGRGLERPGLTYAMQQIAEGKASGLIVSDLRRLSRSIVDLGALMERFRAAGAALVALDLGVDTSTPVGDEVAATLIALGDWEHERIARRTRSGLAEVKASGRRAGRPSLRDRPDLVERITAMRSANMTLQAIADQLNAEGVPTLRGGAMWRPSSVQAALGYRRPGSRGTRKQFPTLEDRM